MGKRSLRWTALAVGFVLLCAVLPTSAKKHKDDGSHRKKLVYYIHESFAPPNTTIVFIAGQDNNLTNPVLGLSTAFDSPLKIGPAENAPVVGSTLGGATLTQDPNVARIYAVHALNSSEAGVGTLAWTGIIGNIGPGIIMDMVVSGGTGDFQFFAGVAKIELVYPTMPPYYPYRTFKFSVDVVKFFSDDDMW